MTQKQIYFYDQNRVFSGSDMIDSDAELPVNATDIKPVSGLYQPITFDGAQWVGVSREEWLASNPDDIPDYPTSQDKSIAALTAQTADAIQQAQLAQKANAALTEKVADLTEKLNALEKGSKE